MSGNADDTSTLQRRVRVEEEQQGALFDLAPDWRSEWWGMPSFDLGDARPLFQITVNFMCADDLREFARRLNVRVTTRTDSVWFPPEAIDRPNGWEYVDDLGGAA